MFTPDENVRLANLYGLLRDKLLDLTRRNRMLSYSLGARSRRSLQIIDAVPNAVCRSLVEQGSSLELSALEEPRDVPTDEKSEDFLEALDHARNTDIAYLTQIQALESTGRDDEFAISAAELELRMRVRVTLGMPPRASLREINRNDHARSLGINPNAELPQESKIKSRRTSRLQTLKFPDELESCMELIASEARLSEQEMGLSTLFLSFGFIEWYASEASDTKSFAPLLLLPVNLERRKVSGKWHYSISSTADSIETNLSLERFLEQEFGRQLPKVETFEEETIPSVDEYLARVIDTIQGLPRWKIHRWMVLGHFSFGRLAMYADLAPENWKNSPVDHQLLKVILQGSESAGDHVPTTPHDYDVDNPEIEKLAPVLVQDADASQHSALVDVMRGTNLVIQGPPGTGKSQTITNIIANALASNKTVLFLAEKRAALDVVKRRLDRCGLGTFCLELHSDKSSAKQIVQNLKTRYELEISQDGLPRKKQKPDSLWRDARSSLKEYLDALHAKDDFGNDTFGLIWRAIRGRSQAFDQVIKTARPTFAFDPSQNYERATSSLRIFSEAAKRFESNHESLGKSIWYSALLPSKNSPDAADSIVSCIGQLKGSIDRISIELEGVPELKLTTIEDLRLLKHVNALPKTISHPELLHAIDGYDLDALEKRLRRRQEILCLDADLSKFPEMQTTNISVFDKAALITKTCEALPILKSPAKDCFSDAKKWLEHHPTAIEAFRSFAPAFDLFKLPGNTEASAIEAIALCIIFASDLKEQQRQWLANGSVVDGSGFARFEAQRTQILKRDTDWRRQFISYRYSAWPSPTELRSTAELLRKGLRGRALAMVASKARRASQIAKTLEFSTNSLGAAETVDRLADHVEQFENFWRDPEHIKLFGEHWLGQETRFDEIKFGIHYREFLQKHLLPLTQGDLVIRRFTSMNAGEILLLSKHAKAGHLFRDLPVEVRTIFRTERISEFEASANSRLAFAKAIVGIDAEDELSQFERSIYEINQIGILDQRRRDLTAEHQRDTTTSNTELLESSVEAARASLEAIAWVRNLSVFDRDSTTRKALVEKDALTARSRFSLLYDKVRPDLDNLDVVTEQLETSFSIKLEESTIQGLSAKLSSLYERRSQVYDALGLHQWQTTLDELGLATFVASALNANISPEKISGLFEAYAARWQVDQFRQSAPAFKKYNGGIIEAYRSAFAKSDREKLKEDCETIKSSLIMRSPVSGMNTGPRRDWTEMWMLKNEFQKQARFAPVRSLIQRAPLSLQALKPCFMMSPLSLAKFVPPDGIDFDLLVIDEASQMRPEDAFGAFLRCKQIVVVGDLKQLPPTEFFNRTKDDDAWDDEESDEDEATESVLESCQKSFGQVRQLKWHYRSRCESLIAFSNREFYGNSLVTFPTARPDSFSVSLIRVEGVYQARRNIAEASRIAEEAIAFMRTFAQRPENEVQSLGIVALNVQQRDLIQAELHRLEAGDELVERYRELAARRGEEVFVKNLENVQGDERDFIFISLTYGKEAGTTALKQRFGPINSKSGHRRLNVLFTRARAHIAVFSSFGSSDIVASPQSNEGIHVLKRYLQYAEQRGRGLVEGIGTDTDNDFESEVAERLRREGFDVDCQVGVSGFRIDLGIKHPDQPSIYLAGVECDGARFHSSKSARDRDRLREEVLSGLGWNILRVWSTDWYSNADEETKKLIQRLNQLRRSPHRQELNYSLRSTYEVKSTSPSFEESDAAAIDELSEVLVRSSSPADAQPLTEEEALSALEVFRDTIIAKEVENWERQRSILRDSMIETLIKQRVSDPGEWIIKIPHYQRSGTNPTEKNRYLSRICQIVRRINVDRLIESGETGETEFKSTLRVNLNTSQRDAKIEFTALRAIASLLNSYGGRLIVGVSDDGNALGLETDGFESEDKMSLHFNNLIHNKIGSQHSAHIEIRFEDFDSKRIMVVSCSRARAPVFLKDAGGEKFFMRSGTATRELTGSQQLEYIRSRFG